MATVWDADVLETKRQTADPLADGLVAAVLDRGESETWQVTRLFAAMARNDSPIPDQLPPTMQAYFADTHLPAWADREKIRRGERLFGTYGVEIVLLLFCKALPLTYCCWRGAEVLVKTGRMTEQTLRKGETFTVINRRIMETAQFVLNVMAPGGFELNGRGLRTAQKIRLIHASIRHFLLQQGWDKETYGLPINQEDLAGTLMAFSYCMIEGLEQLGLKVSHGDREAYLHCWKVVGHFIGLDDDLMPADFASSRQLTETILAGQCGPAVAGSILTKSLVDYMGSKMPFGFGRSVPPLLIRELIGHTRADYLGVRRVPAWESWLVEHCFKFFFVAVKDCEKGAPWLSLLSRYAARKLLQALITENNDYKDVEFYLPPSLREAWNV